MTIRAGDANRGAEDLDMMKCGVVPEAVNKGMEGSQDMVMNRGPSRDPAIMVEGVRECMEVKAGAGQ